jgi:hypothetical protein
VVKLAISTGHAMQVFNDLHYSNRCRFIGVTWPVAMIYIYRILDGCEEIWILFSQVAKTISHEWAQRTSEILFLTREHIIHIFSQPFKYYLQHERPCCIGYTNSSRRREFVYPIQHGREKIKVKVYVNQHESVSHIQIRHAYDFSLCFLHELLMSFLMFCLFYGLIQSDKNTHKDDM